MKLAERLRFWMSCIALIWFTHGIAFFAHEYAHAGTAWVLGYKSNPLAIEYGRLTFANVFLLDQVDENVDYGSIFAQGHGHAAALIAFAGAGISNVFLYGLSRRLLRRQSARRRKLVFLGLYWLCLMNVANFYDYVPIRTFASHGDIANITHGLNISPWLIVVVLGYPTAWAMWHFFARMMRDALPTLAPDSVPQQAALVAVSVFLIFGYFGASGYYGYGEVSHTLSGISMLAVPGITAGCWPSSARNAVHPAP